MTLTNATIRSIKSTLNADITTLQATVANLQIAFNDLDYSDKYQLENLAQLAYEIMQAGRSIGYNCDRLENNLGNTTTALLD